MIYIDVQDIITTYIEEILNSGNDEDKSLFNLGYYNMLSPNKFTFESRVGAKYTSTGYIPCMLEDWEGGFDPLPGIEYSEFSVALSIMVKLDSKRSRVVFDINRFVKSLIARFDTLTITDSETEESTTVDIALGAGIPRTMGASITWGGKRYMRLMVPIDITFGNNFYMGNRVQNYMKDPDVQEADYIQLAPIFRNYNRTNETYPVQLLPSTSLSGFKTKRNLNETNMLGIPLTFVWNASTNFIVNHIIDKEHEQNKIFPFRTTVETDSSRNIDRNVTIIDSNFNPAMGVGAEITIVVVEAYEE